MHKAIIFDWSGTLSDSFSSFYQVIQMMCKHFGKTDVPTPDEVRAMYDAPYMHFWNKILPDMTKEEQDALFPGFIQQAHSPELYPGVKEFIAYVVGCGYKLFLLSAD